MHELFPVPYTPFDWFLGGLGVLVVVAVCVGVGFVAAILLLELVSVKLGLDFGVDDFGTEEQKIALLARQIRAQVVAREKASPRLADDAPHIFRAYHERLFRLNKQRYEEGLTGCYILDAAGNLSLVGDYKSYRRSELEAMGYDILLDVEGWE